MPPTLAILTPRWGAPAETFIRRHLTDLAPNHTIAITRDLLQPDFLPDIPRLHLRAIPETPPELLARSLGIPSLSRRARALQKFLSLHQPQAFLLEWLNFSAKWFPLLRRAAPAGGGARFVAHAHGYDITARALQSPLNLRLYRRLHLMDAIVTVSLLTKSRLISALHLPPEKIHVIPCSVEIPDPIPRNPNPPPNAPLTILCVGRMTPKKGQFLTLRAFAQARQSSPALHLEFIGDGETLPECKNFAADNHLQNTVTFHGTQPPAFVADRLRAADIFALHSVTAPNGDEEGLPVALLEAMAHSLPVVSTLHAGIPEAVADGITGFLVPEHDWPSMADRFLQLAQHPGLRLALGTAARTRALQHFSAPSEISRLRALLFPQDAAP